MADNLMYFLPERGESCHQARHLPRAWRDALAWDGDDACWDDYAELVARYENSLDPQSTDVTVTVTNGSGSCTFEVQADLVLHFRAMEVPERVHDATREVNA